jgi:hypothetical protein
MKPGHPTRERPAVKTGRVSVAAGGAALLLLGGCGGPDPKTPGPDATPTVHTALDDETAAPGVTTVDLPAGADPSYGATPMAQRVAVLGLLNKRNGQARDITLKPGGAVRVGDVIVRLRACEQTAPWEQEHYTGAFVQVDVQQFDQSWHRVFSGWLYKERPGLNVVQNSIYDVWTKSCAMTFPLGGPNSVAAGGAPESEAPVRSSAKKSPVLAPPEVTPEAAPTTPAKAPDSSPK